jgi:glycosyltransferase involved in cell wall biosynthesis
MIDCNILMMMTLMENPITGGEIYNRKLFEFLKLRYPSVENISWNTRTHRSKFQFFLNSVWQNLSFLKILWKINEKTIIIEDISCSSDLYIFNFAIKHLRWIFGKEIRIVPFVHLIYAPLAVGRFSQEVKMLQEKIFLNSSDAIIVNSEFTRISIEAILGRAKDILIAYPGPNISSSKKIKRKMREEANLRLLFVGHITARKGVDTLIEAFRILIVDYGIKNLILDLAGETNRDPAFFREIERYCEATGINDRVCFYGRLGREMLEELYSRADIFVFPSLWESFGMVLVEAMSYSLPIVATDVGAIPYLVKDGQNGFLVSINNPEKLAQAVKKLIDFPDLKSRFGESNYHLALKFNWNESFAEIEHFLDRAFD